MASFLGSWGLPPPVRTQPYWPDSAPGGVHCTRNEERRRTLQQPRVHQYTTRRPRLCSKAELQLLHLFRCIALQNQKCSWTRFAEGPGGPETWHCLGRKLRAFLQIVAPCFPMVAPLFTWLKGHRYLAQSAAFSIFKYW